MVALLGIPAGTMVYDPRVKKARGQVRDESVLNLDLPSTLFGGRSGYSETLSGRTFDQLTSGINRLNGGNTHFMNILQCVIVSLHSRPGKRF